MTYREDIVKLFESDITSYRIGKDNGLSPQLVDKYRKGKSDLGNMTLKNAEKLSEYSRQQLGK